MDKRRKINKNEIPVVILCGGKGTRLQEETQLIPKPLVRIGENPVLWHIMKIYSSYGFNNFILPVGYKGELIKDYFYKYQILQRNFTVCLDGRSDRITYHSSPKENWRITIIDTGLETLTGARLKKIEKFIPGNLFMLTYGDGVARIDLDALLSHHLKHKKIATVTAVKPPARFGGLVIKSGLADGFREKSQEGVDYINGGFFVFSKKVFGFLDERDDLSLEYDVLEKMVNQGNVAAFCLDDYWQCMDTMRDVEVLNHDWQRGNALWKIWK